MKGDISGYFWTLEEGVEVASRLAGLEEKEKG